MPVPVPSSNSDKPEGEVIQQIPGAGQPQHAGHPGDDRGLLRAELAADLADVADHGTDESTDQPADLAAALGQATVLSAECRPAGQLDGAAGPLEGSTRA